jgi:large subunit ribosomal protein L33
MTAWKGRPTSHFPRELGKILCFRLPDCMVCRHNLRLEKKPDPVPPFTETFFLPNMAKSKKKAETIFLVCEETGDYNYSLKRKPGGEKLRLLKYSPRLRKRTWHNEKKK